ncbi:MAG: FliM/FliN family flagellar motor switch protein [Hyphomicrobiaceae bacterium]|jgi:flagellar motor switch protein FliM|nr:FliM/FliN family flagellar motor switch protein [Hyphomicrobiaceae bacterium]
MLEEASGKSAARLTAEKLLETPKLSVDRLPVLPLIFERFGTACTEGLRELCAEPTTLFINQIESTNSWDVLESYEDSAAAIFYSPEWDCRILIGLDRRCIFSLMEAMYGGDGKELPFEGERPFSTLETRVARTAAEIAARALQNSFLPGIATSFVFERVETRIDFSLLGQRNIPVIVGQILFQVLDQGGRIYILIPQSALHPLREKLTREMAPEAQIKDPRWITGLQNGVGKSSVTVQAALEGREATLAELTQLKVGQVLALDSTTRSLIALECEDQRLFWCKLGQANGSLSLVVEEAIDEKDEFMGDILASAT